MRTWPGLAALGAGLIHLGAAAGSPPLQLALLAAAGAVEVLWAVAALARTDPPSPRLSLGGAALLIAAQAAALLGGGHAHGAAAAHAHTGTGAAAASALPVGALVGAVALDLVTAALLAVRLRRGRAAAEPGVLRFLVGTAVAGAAVAVITASSLATTAIGGQHLH